MDTENTSSSSPLPPVDEKEAQKELDRLRNRLKKNERGAFKTNPKWIGFQGKTLWDWLQLVGILAIPLVVAGATLLLGIQQANQTLDQQQAAILQTYIDNIQDLLLHDNLRGSKPEDEVAILARARTLTALQGLNPDRRGVLLNFIYEAQLIGFLDVGKNILHDPIINLFEANLTDVNLFEANLNYASLTDANLSSTNNLTQQQLNQVGLCKGAILPPGLACHNNQ